MIIHHQSTAFWGFSINFPSSTIHSSLIIHHHSGVFLVGSRLLSTLLSDIGLSDTGLSDVGLSDVGLSETGLSVLGRSVKGANHGSG